MVNFPRLSDTAALLLAFAFAAAGARAEDAALPPAAGRAVDFVREIQPILEKNCVKCHGPEKQKSGYRLDVKSVALTGGDEHAPNIVPGKSAESPLIRFVAGLDADVKMPPKGDALTREQVGLLRAWIDQGAEWPESASAKVAGPLDWWSLKPLPVVPGVRDQESGVMKSIDSFIVAKLAAQGMKPSPEADRRTLIRRVTFDLAGLPPTPGEVEAFLTDADPLAYEKLVDRLLASPRYGERWARHWLDVAHYGDSHGYDKDKLRPNAWPYRDYVIRALNDDKPYARFVQEQLAGDALFPGMEDGIAALGFIAAGPWDFIGHAELPESKLDGKIARLLDRDDMVTNTMNTFCALTVQCARCHNHKFDPVTQRDYYRLQAVFAALDLADNPFDTDPAVARWRAALEQTQSDMEKRKRTLAAKVGETAGARAALLEKLIAELRQGASAVERVEFGCHSRIEARQEMVKWVQVDLGAPVDIARVVIVGCHDDFNGIGAGFGFPLRYKVEASDDAAFASGVALLEDQTQADVPNPGVTPRSIAGGTTARYVRITAVKLAPRMNDYIFALAEMQVLDAAGQNVALGAAVTAGDSTDAPPRWQRKNLTDGYYYGHKATASPERIAALEKERAALRADEVPDAEAAEMAMLEKQLAGVKAERAKLPRAKVVYAGTVHTGIGAFAGTGENGGKPRPIFILKRGDVRQPGEEVGPGTVPICSELPATFDVQGQPESARRAALAQWITDPRNPLTWRVIVNRVWQDHFGRGLVDSPSDFGRMGQQPSHPELLDWLAVQFRDGGQSLKQLHRMIVLSATYRQSSADHAEYAKTDAGNTLLWRMNRRKLEAEAVHDSILAVAGKLDLTMGGPGYFDFVIEKGDNSPHYEYALHDADDPKSHRRSIYRCIVRSQPQPFLTVLDCADPSMSVDKRNETVNALQALALRNNALTIAMAKHFAARVTQLAAEPEQQIAAACRLALSRPPTPEESRALSAFAREQGLVNACRVILNLNEFAFVD